MAFAIRQQERALVRGRRAWAVGVDPGEHGGAIIVLTPGLAVHAVVSWSRGPFGKVIRGALAGVPAGALCGLERIVPNRQRLNGFATLAEAAGGPKDALREHGMKVQRPTANEWRRDVLGLGTVSADTAERAAIEAVRGEFQRGRRAQVVLPVTLDTDCGHAAEALCIALWAAGWRLAPGGK